MRTRLSLSAVALALAAGGTPALAQSMDHSAHSEHSVSTPMDHTEQGMNHAEHMAAMNDDVAGAEAILTSYRDALTSRDAEAMAALFAQESFIYENGKAEGSFTHCNNQLHLRRTDARSHPDGTYGVWPRNVHLSDRTGRRSRNRPRRGCDLGPRP